MKLNKITFITGNAAKAEQLRRHLKCPVLHKKIDLDEVQSLDLKKIVEHKSREAYKKISAQGGPASGGKSAVLVEDVSLAFHALGKLPGPLIKWFLGELDNDGLCKMLDGYKNRNATAEVCFGLYDGKELKIFEGKMEGKIATHPRGKTDFGWDPIFIPLEAGRPKVPVALARRRGRPLTGFIPKGSKKTNAEMSVKEQNKFSMRKIALKKLEMFLKK
ncbi:MAG TPA: non-canonical purine NTP pyrophosphatase [Candidatus Paceibacterota bacterium]|nr:non-canonical purine NTP pyrophosphatase [Candidatus Paceibacterota bacterium]